MYHPVYIAKVRPFTQIETDEGKECYNLSFIGESLLTLLFTLQKVKELVKRFQPFSFDNELVISHQKLLTSLMAKAPITPYILRKNLQKM